MPGVTHVAQVGTGVAVRARTFGQCIDAIRAIDVVWNDGPVAGESDATILTKLRAAELPMPKLPNTPLAQTVVGRLHLLLPQQRRARHQLRHRRRPPRRRDDLGRPEVADRGPAADRPASSG